VDAGRVVKGVSFVNLRDAGDPAELASYYDAQGADELVFLDITASSDSRETILSVVEDVSEQVFIPLTVGGGIRTVTDVRKILEAGADKASLNTAALKDPDVISQAANRFGSQCIVVAIDAKRTSSSNFDESSSQHFDSTSLSLSQKSTWEVFTHGGREPTGIDVVKWSLMAEELGAGEILLTSMDADGHENGYDIQLLREVSESVNIPVIASGGAGTLDHFREAVEEGMADAVLAASIFHFGTFDIGDVKDYLGSCGIPVRPVGNLA
tara:strand:- start:526 stop:1329 length:804 start_codon:yes stop_codon:yes gene_type:complete